MSAPLDELYFTWLYGQVADPRIKIPSRTYWRLFRLLYTKEFVWIVPNDDNRIQDGKDLRREFIEQEGLKRIDRGWVSLGCSILELLIALSRRLSFEAEGEPRSWFWELVDNLGLRGYTDKIRYSPDEVSDVLDKLIWRTYAADGCGGLFPLRCRLEPPPDQRKVEIWYQMCAYILDKE